LDLALLDDEEHACRGILLKNVLVNLGLVGVHGVRKLLPFELAQLEQQKVLADGLFNELKILRSLGLVYFLDVLEDLLCRRSTVQPFQLILLLAGVVDRLGGEVYICLV